MDLAEKRLGLAEKGLQAGESNHVSETLQRAALIELAQKEIKSARSRLEESRKYFEKLELRGEVLGIRGRSTAITRKLREHKILLEWMERQRRVITSESATFAQDTERHSKQSQGKKAKSRELRNRFRSEMSRSCKSSKGDGDEGRRPKARSILSPVLSLKVSKSAANDSSRPRQRRTVSRDAQPTDEDTIIDSSSKRISKLEDNIPALGLERTFLRPIHSAKVSKATRKVSDRPHAAELHMEDTKLTPNPNRPRIKRQGRQCKSSAPSSGPRPPERPAHASTQIRRSRRISKKPERVCPSSTWRSAAARGTQRFG